MSADEEKPKKGLSRRDFIKGAAAGAAVAGAGAIAACAPTPTAAPTAVPPTAVPTKAPAAPTATPAGAAPAPTAKPAIVEPAFQPEVSVLRDCSFGGFGRGTTPVRVEVKDGKIVRIRNFKYADEGYGPDKLKTWKMEVKGKTLTQAGFTQGGTLGLAYKKRVYSPNRVKFPLKRVDWEPGGDPAKINSKNRGISKYKRISWDEATDIIAKELMRLWQKYGYFSVLACADGHGEGKVVHGPHGCQTQLLRWCGPKTNESYTLSVRTPDSWEGWYWGGKHMWGMETRGTGYPSTNHAMAMAQNCQLMLNMHDVETTGCMSAGQFKSNLMYWMSDVGIEHVYIAPDLNYSAAVHSNKWIPVLPCQDTALFFAVAYIWFQEGTYDKEYLATHAVGFDKYQDYILGKEDGVPKTPEWAAPRCGVPEWTIKALAHNWVKKTTALGSGTGNGAFCRGPYSTEPCRSLIACMGMQGMGKPGTGRYGWGGTPSSVNQISYDKTLVRGEPCPARGLEEWESAYDYFRPNQFIPKTLIPEAILKKNIKWWGGTCSAGMLIEDQWRQFEYPIAKDKGGTEIHMLWTDTPCWTACWNGGNRYGEAMRDPSMEFVLAEHPWLEDDCLFSDIILPTTTKYEEYDIAGAAMPDGYGATQINRDCIKPVGESKTDYEVSLEIAKKLEKMGKTGLVQKYTWGRDVEGWMSYGWDTRKLKDITGMTFAQFKERELYIDPMNPKWEDGLKNTNYGGLAFYQDPKKNPLQTPTGLLEYESTGLKKNLPDDKERPPVPHWIVGGPRSEGWSHDETMEGQRAKKYPYLIISNHPRWGEHSTMDDCSWFREVEDCKVRGLDGYQYHPAWIHPNTAKEIGVVNGDVVSVYNERGTVLVGAYVTERIIPGAISIDHQARLDPIYIGNDVPRSEWIDRGGQINLICPDEPGIVSKNAPGQVASGFLVGAKKTDLAALKAKYPEAFNKPYDPASGLRSDAWIAA